MNKAMAEPLVSVIIPAYQAQDYIENCVRSVCSQKISEDVINGFTKSDNIIEVIIVDDGSKDSTGRICDELSVQFSNVKVLHVKNGGVSKARNLGIENSCGRYIAFVDADDLVEESYISDLLRSAAQNNADIVIMDGKIKTDELISGYRYIEDGILSEDTHVWGKLFIRSLLEEDGKIRFPEGITIGEDMLFLLDILIKAGSKKCISMITGSGYRYNFNDSGAMLTEFKPSYFDQIKCWDIADERLNKMEYELSDKARLKFAVIRIMAALLVVSKFAKSNNMRENIDKISAEVMKDKVIGSASQVISKALRIKGSYNRLSAGYKIKVAIFRFSPDLYIKLYGQWKKR